MYVYVYVCVLVGYVVVCASLAPICPQYNQSPIPLSQLPIHSMIHLPTHSFYIFSQLFGLCSRAMTWQYRFALVAAIIGVSTIPSVCFPSQRCNKLVISSLLYLLYLVFIPFILFYVIFPLCIYTPCICLYIAHIFCYLLLLQLSPLLSFPPSPILTFIILYFEHFPSLFLTTLPRYESHSLYSCIFTSIKGDELSAHSFLWKLLRLSAFLWGVLGCKIESPTSQACLRVYFGTLFWNGTHCMDFFKIQQY
jgi:hypothetical protein